MREPILAFRSVCPGDISSEDKRALYIDAFQVGDYKFAFYCVATMTCKPSDDDEGMCEWISSHLIGKEISLIRDFATDYRKFAAQTKRLTEIETIIMANYDQDGPKPG